ncbi:PAS domain-containing response regulator [Halorubellus salinus]|uniref:PAS domain-containing response regulator n=1 Tax=Halorubellus salinus TaxID=755309 RepID=UPI001D0739BD|nr:PAS domain S-box protein [Halorubellus salinus]
MTVGVERNRGGDVRVLHAEDDPQLGALAGEFLEREGELAVTHVEDAPTALERLAAEDFECIVSDYDMPGMTGIEFLDAVREDHPDLPFILFTGKGSEEVASDAISKGVTDYLQKETGTEQYEVLANRIENAVDGYRTERELERRVKQLRESERRFRTLVSNLPGMVYRCENERGWPMTFVSDGAVELTGYTPDELTSDAVDWGEDVLVDANRDELWEAVQAALDAREPFQVEYELRTADGESKWVWERGRGVFENDELLALEGFITDVTDERRLREDLRRERDLTRQLVETSPVGIMVHELDGTYHLVNDRVLEIFDTAREAVMGRTYDDDEWELRTPDGDPLPEAEHGFAKLKAKAEGTSPSDDVRLTNLMHSVVRDDGERLLVSVNGAPLYDDDDELELLVFTIQVVDE